MSGPEAGVMFATVLTIATVTLTWVTLHYRSKRGVLPKELVGIEQRLAQIERALDAVAVETERISEGQRFTTKLLSERNPAQRVERS